MDYSPDTEDSAQTDPTAFAELNCLSNYSFLQGASHPEELVKKAVELGYQGLALTDECSVAGIVKAWQEASRHPDFKLITGSEFRYQHELFVYLARDRAAYGALCTLISRCRREAVKGSYQFHPTYLESLKSSSFLLYSPFLNADQAVTDPCAADTQAMAKHWIKAQLHTAEQRLSWLKPLFPEQLYLIEHIGLLEADHPILAATQQLAKQFRLPTLASNRVLMHSPQRKKLHDCLSAIRLGTPLKKLQPRLKANAENHLRNRQRLGQLYSTDSLCNTINVLNQCHFSMDEIRYRYPRSLVPDGLNADQYLEMLTYEGAQKRYHVESSSDLPEKVQHLLSKELQVIAELDYACYFLTIYDIVRYARQKNILCQGRGSAANSIVCFCLFITEVDPMRVDVLFERFISRRRNEPPDIDVDFENARREEVIQYIYQKYGREHCAIAATVIRYRPKSAIRDLAKALEIDLEALEKVIANYGWRYRGANWVDEVITEAVCQNQHTLTCFKGLLQELLGFPRHLSQHVGGFIITDTPLIETVPVENASMPDRTVIQWEKDDLEYAGLMKVDILALGMLSAIQKTLQDISRKTGREFTLACIPSEDDPAVYQMLQKADSVGLFQVESRAQMNMLPRLKPECYYDLVVQVAIVRPGPIHGDMVHPYLKRKHGEEPIDIPLPELKPILERTYGVPIFQEQVIAMAMAAASFSADEAEELRRSMASWKREGHMHRLRIKMSDQLVRRGLSESYVERLCRQIEGFGEYGFPESHAASFALIAYASAWLKYYYPAEFCCGLLNSQPMGFYQPWQLIQDIRRHQVEILPIDINHSEWDHQVVDGKLRLGFRLISGLEQEETEAVCRHRPSKGYRHYQEITAQSGIKRSALEKMANANAFQSLFGNRHQQTWEASGTGFYYGLFEEQHTPLTPLPPMSRIEEIQADYQATGVILNDHPLAYLRDKGFLKDCVTASSLEQLDSGQEIYVAGMVINRQRPKTSAGVTFVTLEDETGSINLVIWLQTAVKQLEPLVKSSVLKVYGKVDKDPNGDVIHVIAYRLFDISQLLAINHQSRDFH